MIVFKGPGSIFVSKIVPGPFYWVILGTTLVIGTASFSADRLSTVAEADLGGGYSSVMKGSAGGGVVGSAFLMPAYRLTDSFELLPAYSFDGFLYDQAVEEDVYFQSRQVHTGMLGYRERIADDLEMKLFGEAAWGLTRETRDEMIGHGLYDSRDLGARGTVVLNRTMNGRPAPLSLGIRAFDRKYPNFLSIAYRNASVIAEEDYAAAEVISEREKRPKNFLGVEPRMSGVWWRGENTRFSARYEVGMRYYSDRYLRTSQGEMSESLRFDHAHRLGGEYALFASDRFYYGTGLEGLFNASNGSVFRADQPRRQYISRYFQFYQAGIDPWVQWNLPWGTSGKRSGARLGAGFLYRGYTGRPSQDKAGVFMDKTQSDQEYTVDLKGWYPLNGWLNANLGFSMRFARSNMLYDRYVKYNYDLYTVSAGVSASFNSAAVGHTPAVRTAPAPVASGEPEEKYDPEEAAKGPLLLYMRGKNDAALDQARALADADPVNWRAWQLIGNCLYAKGDNPGALTAYDKSLEINPDNEKLRNYADSLKGLR